MPHDKPKKIHKEERKIEREIIGIILFGLLIVVIFLISQQIFKKLNQFEYEGLAFTKTKIDQFPVYYYYYSWVDASGNSFRYNLYLRTDPRENTVPISGDAVTFDTKRVYVTVDTAYLDDCKDSAAAIGDLALFLKDNQFNVKGASMDYTWAAIRGQPHVTCENTDNANVIEIVRGSETSIVVNGRCNRITIGPSCDVFNATEKFKLETVIEARNRAISS